MVIAVLAAGGGFAAGGVLQQRAASTRPESEALSLRLLLQLAHDPLWLLGIAFALVSYVLDALALSLGPLVLVQPLIVSELLFALPISVRLQGERGVAQPHVAVVPVAHPTQALGQRGRERGDDPPGRPVGEGLERGARPADRIAPLHPVDATCGPGLPPRLVASRCRRASAGSGSLPVEGSQLSTKGTCPPAETVNLATVVWSSPSVATGVSSTRASGPATAMSRPSSGGPTGPSARSRSASRGACPWARARRRPRRSARHRRARLDGA